MPYFIYTRGSQPFPPPGTLNYTPGRFCDSKVPKQIIYIYIFSKWWVLCGRIICRTPKALKSWTAPPPPSSLIPSAFLYPLTHSGRNKDWHEPQLLLWTSASCCTQSWNSTCPLVVSCRSHPQSTPLILLCFLAMRLITPSNGSLWSPV